LSKLVYIITVAEKGGAQVHVLELLRYFSAFNEVYLIVGSIGFLTEKAEELGINVEIVSNLVQPISFYKDIQATQEIYFLLRKIQPNLVHCHSSKAGLLGRIAAYFAHVPSVFTAHGWAFTEGSKLVNRLIALPLEWLAARLTRRIICVSKYDTRLALRYRTASLSVLETIHNGVEDSHLIQMHNEACVYAAQRIENCVFQFVGEGELEVQVKQLVSSLNLESRVRFLGSRSDVNIILANSDIFVLMSHYEGFPISILEAMQAGLPVVASDVGGVSEAVEDGVSGFLIPRYSDDLLVERLKLLVEDSVLRKKLGEAARTRFETHFTVASMLAKVADTYKKVLIG
jgi:glycosyltransferase involved in cell wall biosynthesis